jgi:two-component sensor histidine kinase
MTDTLRLLHIEDSLSDAKLIERLLTKAGYKVFSERVVDADEMRRALANGTWDVIIADYRLPNFDAPAALSLLRESGQDVPFIVVSGAIGEELAVAIMRAGAEDYLLKDDMARLAPAVEREIREASTRRGRAQAERALNESRNRIIEQRAALERQGAVLQHRETMLREIHHRVKNNMQVMSSLLSLQARGTSNGETKRMLEENQNRIQSMALLHEILYQSQDLAMVDFSKYVLRMAHHLFLSYGVDSQRIRLETDLDPIALELDDALPLGLLISEAVSNSLKHAFPAGGRGLVRIELRRNTPTSVVLKLSDDGVGLSPDLDWTTSRSLGLRLVRALAEQLRGNLHIGSHGGTEIKLTFYVKPHTSSPEVELRAGGGA